MLMIAVPDRTPCYVEVACETCKRPVWYRLSRVDPIAWTEADFLAEHNIDREKNLITRKDGKPVETGK